MKKEAWTYSLAAAVMGAVGMFLRWLQCQYIFRSEDGLAARGAPLSIIFTFVIILFGVGLWLLSGRIGADRVPSEPDEALASPARGFAWVMGAGAFIAALGALVLFFREDSLLYKITALAGFFSAAVLALLPYLPRWERFGCFLAALPVLFFCLWLVAFYKENSTNPTLWEYSVEIVAIAAALAGAFQISAFPFYRGKPRHALFCCGLALMMGLTMLMDRGSLADRAILLGWGIGLGAMTWALLRNGSLPEADEPAVSA